LGRERAGVEVDRVAHRAAIDQGDLEPVSNPAVQDLARTTSYVLVVGATTSYDVWLVPGSRVRHARDPGVE
jgi:hypothetical protein